MDVRSVSLVLATLFNPVTGDIPASESITITAYPGFSVLRTCALCCLGIGLWCYSGHSLMNAVQCSVNSCLCRSDVVPLAMSALSDCVSKSCSNKNDVTSYQILYKSYCALDYGNPCSTETVATEEPTSSPLPKGTVTITKPPVTKTEPPTKIVSFSVSTSMAIALGVGIGIGLPALVATMFFGYAQVKHKHRRRERRLGLRVMEMDEMMPSSRFHGQYNENHPRHLQFVYFNNIKAIT